MTPATSKNEASARGGKPQARRGLGGLMARAVKKAAPPRWGYKGIKKIYDYSYCLRRAALAASGMDRLTEPYAEPFGSLAPCGGAGRIGRGTAIGVATERKIAPYDIRHYRL